MIAHAIKNVGHCKVPLSLQAAATVTHQSGSSPVEMIPSAMLWQ